MQSILVVEDEALVRESLILLLTEAGYRCASACNGAEALAALRTGVLPDLIVLDLMMPVMNGWQFLDALRADADLAGIPVLVASGSASGDTAPVLGPRDGLLLKPYSPAGILRRVDQFGCRRARD